MPERILFPQWRRENEATAYPFSPAGSLTTDTGRVLLPGVFLDAALYVIGAVTPLGVNRVTVTHAAVTLSVGTAAAAELASGTFPLVNPPGSIELLDPAGRPAGLLVSTPARLSAFQGWGVGVHEFAAGAAEFCATACFPTPEVGLRGVALEDGTVLSGDVWLVGGAGVVLRSAAAAGLPGCAAPPGGVAVRLDAVGDPLFRRRLCADAGLFQAPRFVKTLRVVSPAGTFDVAPDARGGVTLTVNNDLAADTVLRAVVEQGGLRVGAAVATAAGT